MIHPEWQFKNLFCWFTFMKLVINSINYLPKKKQKKKNKKQKQKKKNNFNSMSTYFRLFYT